jgi:glycine/D-amino acid oxidase-like deaminating enzyme
MATSRIYDWIVVGNGIAGAALSYELQKQGASVLVLDAARPDSATRYSYGGIAYWSGTTDLMRQLCQEGIERHRQLAAELDATTELRELNLLLTVAPQRDPAEVASRYAEVAITPKVLTAAEACELEPLLNPEAISGALHLPHGHVSPLATVAAYNQAFLRLGGVIEKVAVTGFMQQYQQIQGVTTPDRTYTAANVVLCAGATIRSLLQTIGLRLPVYFTHAEIIEAAATEVNLLSLIMPAELKRFVMEAEAGTDDALWDQPGQEILPAILDAGIVQFCDGRLLIGQVSRTLTDLDATVDQAASEQLLRQTVAQLMPALQQVAGRWRSSRVAFSADRLPLVGAVPAVEGMHLFTGFSNPFAILPALAVRFARAATGTPDPLLLQMAPGRFA